MSRHHNRIQQLQLWENTVNVYVLKFIFKAKKKNIYTDKVKNLKPMSEPFCDHFLEGKTTSHVAQDSSSNK